MWFGLLLLGACGGPPPRVDSVEPAALWPGEAVEIRGDLFGENALVSLVAGDLVVPLPLEETSPTLLRTHLPEDLPPARWTIEVHRDRHAVRGPVLDVWTPDAEPPCTKRYALDVDVSRELRRVVLQRIFEDRDSTQEVFVGDAITALAWERIPLADGAICEAVWLLDDQGHKWLLADDTTRDLVVVAEQLGLALRVPAVPLHGVTSEGAR